MGVPEFGLTVDLKHLLAVVFWTRLLINCCRVSICLLQLSSLSCLILIGRCFGGESYVVMCLFVITDRVCHHASITLAWSEAESLCSEECPVWYVEDGSGRSHCQKTKNTIDTHYIMLLHVLHYVIHSNFIMWSFQWTPHPLFL